MPLYTISRPIYHVMDSDSVKEAIKQYIKLYHNYSIRKMIIQDQANHYEAKIKSWKADTRNKYGINYYPIDYYNIKY